MSATNTQEQRTDNRQQSAEYRVQTTENRQQRLRSHAQHGQMASDLEDNIVGDASDTVPAVLVDMR